MKVLIMITLAIFAAHAQAEWIPGNCPSGAERTACFEWNYPNPGLNKDNDCCAAAGAGRCAAGHIYSMGGACYSSWWSTGYSTCCTPFQAPSKPNKPNTSKAPSKPNTARRRRALAGKIAAGVISGFVAIVASVCYYMKRCCFSYRGKQRKQSVTNDSVEMVFQQTEPTLPPQNVRIVPNIDVGPRPYQPGMPPQASAYPPPPQASAYPPSPQASAYPQPHIPQPGVQPQPNVQMQQMSYPQGTNPQQGYTPGEIVVAAPAHPTTQIQFADGTTLTPEQGQAKV